MKRVELWNESVSYGTDLCDGTLVGAIRKLQELAASVAPEHLNTVKFEFVDEGYGEPSFYLKIWYSREETAEELEAARRETERRSMSAEEYRRHQELAALALLKAKYPDA